MSFKEHLRHLLPHAEWWGIEWAYHHYREVVGSVMLAALGAIAQKAQGIPYDWWVLGILFFGSLGLMVYSHRKDRRQQVIDEPSPIEVDIEAMERSSALSLRQALSASTVIDTGQALSVVIFVVEEAWVDRKEKENFPLKLRMRWANQGDGAHIGKPRWEPTRAHIPDRQLMCRFKSLSGKYKTESEEIDIKRGERGELWLALDPAMNIEQVERWREASQLGVLTLPIMIGTTTREVQIQL